VPLLFYNREEIQMKREKRRPGRGATRHRPNIIISELTELGEVQSFLSRHDAHSTIYASIGLAVGPPNRPRSTFEREFVAKVMDQLPGLSEPSIFVPLNQPKQPIELDALRLVTEHGAPVAIADMSGKLLAYREP
jgi:hypothetical protein